jgi:hypothetical protein
MLYAITILQPILVQIRQSALCLIHLPFHVQTNSKSPITERKMDIHHPRMVPASSSCRPGAAGPGPGVLLPRGWMGRVTFRSKAHGY